MQEKPSVRSILAVPRAIASAVSDWRRSGGGTGLTWRAGDSIAASLSDSATAAIREVVAEYAVNSTPARLVFDHTPP